MLRLLLADLRRHAGTWAWTCVITLVAGACVSGQLRILHGALDSAAKATGVTPQGVPRSTDMLHAARLMSGFIIALIVLAAAAVLVSTAGLAFSRTLSSFGRESGGRPTTVTDVVWRRRRTRTPSAGSGVGEVTSDGGGRGPRQAGLHVVLGDGPQKRPGTISSAVLAKTCS